MTIATIGLQVRSLARHDWRSTIRSVVLQSLLLVTALQAYQLVRTLAEGDRGRAFANSRDLLRFEELTGLDVERGLQALSLRSDGFIDAVNAIYVATFWPIVIATLPVLFVFARPQYRHYRNALIISGAVGLAVFAVYPVAPPRMLEGYVDTIFAFSDSSDFARPGSFTNEYAAMPSFHVGWLVLAAAAAMPAVPWRAARPLLFVPAVVMTFTVMATANHYLVDAIAGAALALGGLYVSHRLPTAEAVRAWADRTCEPVGGVSGVAARVGKATLVGLIALSGGGAVATYRDSDRAAANGRDQAAERPVTLRSYPAPMRPVDELVDHEALTQLR